MVTLTWGVTEGYADFHDWLGLFQENDDKKSLKHCYVKSNKVSRSTGVMAQATWAALASCRQLVLLPKRSCCSSPRP